MDGRDSQSLTELVAQYLPELRENAELTAAEFALRIPEPLRASLQEQCEAAHLAYDFMRPRTDPWRDPRGIRIGDYTLIEELGRGGMGIVFRAEQAGLGREAAIKILPPSWNPSERAYERFRREGMAIAKLDDPRIVRVYAVGEEEGIYYLAMELVRGHSLQAELEALRNGSTLEASALALGRGARKECVREVAGFFARCARALDAAHEGGVVHRDVSPKNILVDAKGEARIIDFGLARIVEEPAKTLSGVMAGTPAYMSPEQAGSDASGVDHRSDIYSLAAVLYEALTLERPFDGESHLEIFEAIRTQEALPIHVRDRALPEDLSAVVQRAMEKRASDRFDSAASFAAELERVAAGEPTLTRAPGWTKRSRRWLLARRRLLIGGFAVTTASALGVLAGARRGRARAQLIIEREDLRDAEVYYREPDIESWTYAPAERLGTVPIRTSVPVGPCRIILKRGAAFAELVRDFALEGYEYELNTALRLAPPDEYATSMPSIAEGRAKLGRRMSATGGMLGLDKREIEIAAFRVDRDEVSIGEYRRFARETGLNLPDWIPSDDSWRSEWDELPACGITQTDAIALAEWSGRRLPTADELEFAARGPEARALPWQTETAPREAILERARLARDAAAGALPDKWAAFLAAVMTVSDVNYAQTSEGLRHILGNVAEWTETPHRVRNEDGTVRRQGKMVIAKGGSFRDTEWPLGKLQYAPSFISVHNIGLRRAKSEDPFA